MLKTCLKHDLRAYRRYITLASLLVLTATFVAGALLRFFTETIIAAPTEDTTLLQFLATFAMIPGIFCIIGIVISPAAPGFMSIWRMYSHFYTDQGYLTFTLPVKRSTLYLSKILSALIVQAIALGEAILSAAILCLVIPPTAGNDLIDLFVYKAIGDFLSLAWKGFGGWLILWVLLALILLVAVALIGMGLYYLCLTIGAVVAKKHKLIAAIGIYYLVNMVFTFASQIITTFFISGLVTSLALAAERGMTGPAVTVFLVMAIAISSVIAISFHLSTIGQIERRLNLA